MLDGLVELTLDHLEYILDMFSLSLELEILYYGGIAIYDSTLNRMIRLVCLLVPTRVINMGLNLDHTQPSMQVGPRFFYATHSHRT